MTSHIDTRDLDARNAKQALNNLTELAAKNLANIPNPNAEPLARLTLGEELLRGELQTNLRFLEGRLRAAGDFIVFSRCEAQLVASFFKENLETLERKQQASGIKRHLYDLIADLSARAANVSRFTAGGSNRGIFADTSKTLWNCLVDVDNFLLACAKTAKSHAKCAFSVNIFERPCRDAWDSAGLGSEFTDAEESFEEDDSADTRAEQRRALHVVE